MAATTMGDGPPRDRVREVDLSISGLAPKVERWESGWDMGPVTALCVLTLSLCAGAVIATFESELKSMESEE
ncbi:MAG: hypothetical protein U0236_03850 [Nitrospira sp.]